MKSNQKQRRSGYRPFFIWAIATVISSGFADKRCPAQEWVSVDHFPEATLDYDQDTQLGDPLGETFASSDLPVECHDKCQDKCLGVDTDPGHPAKPKHKKPGDINEGDCPSIRYRMDDCLRAGDPNCVYQWAAPSITQKYSAWYVGGGAAFKGRGRTSAEGTWGLDYDGFFGHARTWLNYTCGKRQGGEGAYQTDHVPLKKKLSALH